MVYYYGEKVNSKILATSPSVICLPDYRHRLVVSSSSNFMLNDHLSLS